MNTDVWFLGLLQGVRGKFPEHVSGAAVGPMFTGHESERKWATCCSFTHSGFQNRLGTAAMEHWYTEVKLSLYRQYYTDWVQHQESIDILR